MIFKLSNNFYLSLNNPSQQWTAGIHFQSGLAFDNDEEGNPIENTQKQINMLYIGCVIFNLNIIW